MKHLLQILILGIMVLCSLASATSPGAGSTPGPQQPSFGVFMPPPTVLSSTSATLAAWVTYSTPNVQQITWAFQYGLTAALGTTTPEETRLTTDGVFAVTITNLIPNTNYFCRAWARDANGMNVYSDTLSFTNVSPPIGRITVTDVTTNRAAVEIGVNPNGTNPVVAWLDIYLGGGGVLGRFFGPFTLPGGTNEVVVSGTVSNLQPVETYICSLRMQNLAGDFAVQQEIASLPFPPVAGICTLTNLRATRVEVACFVEPNLDSTTVWFEWGATTSYGRRTEAQTFAALATNGFIGGVYIYWRTNYIVAGELRDLTSETTYHVRCVATNRGGITYGADAQFRTTDLRPIILGTEGSPLLDGAVLRGVFSPNGSTADAYFQYGPTTSLDLSTPVATSPEEVPEWTYPATLTGLTTGLTYYYRLVVSNSYGVAMGKIQTLRLGAVNFCTEEDLRFAMQRESLIEFNCDGVIVLSNTLVINKDITFNAATRQVTISGGNSVRVLLVNTNVSLTLNHLTIADAQVTGPAARGAGIHNVGGRVHLVDCVLSNLWAFGETGNEPDIVGAKGGAIFNGGGEVSALGTDFVTNGVSRGNGAEFNLQKGGAICSLGGAITLDHCRLEQNWAIGNIYSPALPFWGDGMGGAVFTDGSTVLIQRSRFIRNMAVGGGNGAGFGGACTLIASEVTLAECLFDGNRAIAGAGIPGGYSYGGAVLFRDLNAGLTNCTFSQNGAHGAHAQGGAILLQNGVVDAAHVTIVSNEVPASPRCSAPNLALESGSVLRLRNTIVANPKQGSNVVYSADQIIDAGGNLQWPGGSVSASIVSLDPRLGPLADNGGFTLTHALLPGSPAIDGATNEHVIPIDQRGYPRPVDGDGDCSDRPDVGAFEFQGGRQVSALVIDILPDSRVRLRATGVAGKRYTVYTCSDLNTFIWSPTSSIASDETGRLLFFDNSMAGPRFYQITLDCPQ